MGLNFENALAEYVSLGDITEARFEALKPWSTLAFFRVEDKTADDRTFISKWGSTGASQQFIVRVDDGAGATEIQVFLNGVFVLGTGGDVVESDIWYLVCVTNDGTGGANSLNQYLLDMSGAFLGNDASVQHDTDNTDLTEPILISGYNSGASDEMDGDIDYPCYIQKELNKSEMVRYLFDPVGTMLKLKQGAGVPFCLKLGNLGVDSFDLSGSKNHGTINLSPSRGDNPPSVILYPIPIALSEPTLAVDYVPAIFGDLGAGGAAIALDGFSDAVSAVFGNILVNLQFNSVVNISSLSTGDLRLDLKFNSLANSVSETTSDLRLDILLNSVSEAASSFIGDVRLDLLLSGVSNGVSTANGSIRLSIKLNSVVNAISLVTGSLGGGQIFLDALSDALSSATGDLRIDKFFNASVQGQSKVVGDMRLDLFLNSVVLSNTDVQGAINLQLKFSSASEALSEITGDLRLDLLLSSNIEALSSLIGDITTGEEIEIIIGVARIQMFLDNRRRNLYLDNRRRVLVG